jgi:hypothetical protein
VRTFRRWFLRLIALVALVGVGYGVYTIVKEGTKDDGKKDASAIEPALKKLAKSQEALAGRLDKLTPGRAAPKLAPAIRVARHDQEAAVTALRRRQAKHLDIPDESQLQDALGAEFDYLDALGSVTHNRHSSLLKSVGDRAQAAKDAFTDLTDSQGVEDGIRGTQAFIAWARARR